MSTTDHSSETAGPTAEGTGFRHWRLALAGVIVFSGLFGAAIALNMRHGMAIYAERLISGLAGCF